MAAACLSVTVAACAAPVGGDAGGVFEQACRVTSDGYTICDPAAPLPSGATPPPPPRRVAASDSSFAGVALGMPVEDAKRRLIAALGEPEEETEGGCLKPELRDSLTQPSRGKRLTWPGLEVQVFFAPQSSRELALTGWRVRTPRQPPSRYRFVLPYGVKLDEPADDAQAKIPESRRQKIEYGADSGSTVITTPALPSLAVDLAPGDATVAGAYFDPEGCN